MFILYAAECVNKPIAFGSGLFVDVKKTVVNNYWFIIVVNVEHETICTHSYTFVCST